MMGMLLGLACTFMMISLAAQNLEIKAEDFGYKHGKRGL
jgi:Spy/CpxP family protein refolding chaperone